MPKYGGRAPAVSQVPEVQACIALLRRCQRLCEDRSASWLGSSRLGTAALRCIRLMLECADLCAVTGGLLQRGDEITPVFLRSHLRACAQLSARCAQQIEVLGCDWAFDCAGACDEVARACDQTTQVLPRDNDVAA